MCESVNWIRGFECAYLVRVGQRLAKGLMETFLKVSVEVVLTILSETDFH